MSPARKTPGKDLAKTPNVPEPAQATVGEATARAANVREILVAGWQQFLPIIEIAHAKRDYLALGYKTFNQYLRVEYRGLLPRFDSIEERETVIKELTAAGFSQRDAGVVSGTSAASVNRVLNPPQDVPNETPQPEQQDEPDQDDQRDDDEPEQQDDDDDEPGDRDLDMKRAARYVITELDRAYPHRRVIRLLAERYDGGTRDPATGNRVSKDSIIRQVLDGLGDQVVESEEPLKGHIVGLAEPIDHEHETLMGLRFNGEFVKSGYTPPEDVLPFEEAFKLARASEKKLLAMQDVAGLDATDAHDLGHPMGRVKEAYDDAQDFLAALQGDEEAPLPLGACSARVEGRECRGATRDGDAWCWSHLPKDIKAARKAVRSENDSIENELRWIDDYLAKLSSSLDEHVTTLSPQVKDIIINDLEAQRTAAARFIRKLRNATRTREPEDE